MINSRYTILKNYLYNLLEKGSSEAGLTKNLSTFIYHYKNYELKYLYFYFLHPLLIYSVHTFVLARH